jgi:hypothetical protein
VTTGVHDGGSGRGFKTEVHDEGSRRRFGAALGWSLVCLLMASIPGCRNIDVVTASYANLDEARKAGALERGWLPDHLPPGAHDIREAHDLDSSRQWGLFSFPVSETDVLRRLLEPGEVALDGLDPEAPARIEWWPVILRGALEPDSIRATGLRAYKSRSADRIFVVNWNQGRAYYWSISGR